MKDQMFIVVGPSGVGKSSLVERVVLELGLYDVVTCTTRAMREGEKQGIPYFFVTQKEFDLKKSMDEFVEFAKVHNHFYATPRSEIQRAWAKGLAVVIDVDVQGAESLKAVYPQAVSLFILPPSIDLLRQRVRKRDGDQSKDLELRMDNAVREIEQASEFDYQLVNDDFEESYLKFKKIIENHLSIE